jgi:hypothetical protein
MAVIFTKFIKAGRPRINISVESVRFLRREGFTYEDIAGLLGICSRTLLRRRRDNAIPDDAAYTVVSNDQLDSLLRRIRMQQPYSGQQILMGALRSYGCRVSTYVFNEMLFMC